MKLLTVNSWNITQDKRWYISSETEYYLTIPRIERNILLLPNPQKLEKLELDKHKIHTKNNKFINSFCKNSLHR